MEEIAIELGEIRGLGFLESPEDIYDFEDFIDGMDAQDHLATALECSYRLARLMQRYMPPEKAQVVKWNPCFVYSEDTDEQGVGGAAVAFFQYVDEHMFPFDYWDFEEGDLWRALSFIPPTTRADPVLQDGIFDVDSILGGLEPTSLYRLVAVLVRAAGYRSEFGRKGRGDDLRSKTLEAWGLPVLPVVDLKGIDGAIHAWVSEGGEQSAYAEGFSNLLHLIDLSTDHFYLDAPYEMLGFDDSESWLRWDDDDSVQWCKNEWTESEAYIEKTVVVEEATKTDEALRQKIKSLIEPYLRPYNADKGKSKKQDRKKGK